MNKSKATQVFLRKAFMQFFIPSMLSSVALAIGGLADCFFVGSQIGADGLTVIGFGAPIYAFFSLVSSGISTGASIRYAAAVGEGNVAKGQAIFRNALFFVFLLLCVISAIGIIFRSSFMRFLGVTNDTAVYGMMIEYLTVMLASIPIMFMQAPFYFFVNSDGNPKLAAAALVSANVVDVALNFVLVVVMKMGVLGSIYSTLGGAIVTIVLCQLHIFSEKSLLCYGRFRPCLRTLWNAVAIGFASDAKYAYQFVVLLVFNHLMMRLWGENGIACLDVVMNISLLVYSVMDGVGMTLEPMISTFYAERNRGNITATLRNALLLGGIVCCLLSLLLAALTLWYAPMFGLNTPTLMEGFNHALRIYLLRIPIAFTINVFAYYYQTTEREGLAFGLIFLSEAAGLLICGFLFARGGFQGFWWCYFASDLLTILLFSGYYLLKRSAFTLRFQEPVFSAFICDVKYDLQSATMQIQQFCTVHGATEKQAYFVTVAIDEVVQAIYMRNSSSEVYVQLTLVKEADSDYVLHLRDNSHVDFSPFSVDTEDIMNEGKHENAIGMKLVKRVSKKYLYRKYAGFNTLTIRL